MKAWSDYLLNVPSADTPRIQESHILLGHIVCHLLKKTFFHLQRNLQRGKCEYLKQLY
jgi:D-sedoheptulose 7-phosphate isomerase